MNIPEFSNNSFQDPQQANESNDKAKNPKVVMGRKRAAGMTKPVGSNEKTVVDEVNKISSKIHNDDLSVTPHTSNKIQELKPKQTPRKEEIESDDEEIITEKAQNKVIEKVVEEKIIEIKKGKSSDISAAKEEKKDLSSMSPYEIMNKEIKKIFSAELSNVGKGRINVEKLVKICNLYVSASELIDILYEINASSKTLPEVKQVYNFLLECIKLPYFKNDFLEVETNKKLVFLYNSIKENNSTKLNNNIKIEDLENLFTSQLDITEYKEIADNEDNDKYISDNLSSIISNKCYGMGIKDIMNENNKYVDVMNSIKCYFLNILLSGKNVSNDLRTLSNIGSHSNANHDYATAMCIKEKFRQLTDLLTFDINDSNNKKFFYEHIDTLIAEKKSFILPLQQVFQDFKVEKPLFYLNQIDADKFLKLSKMQSYLDAMPKPTLYSTSISSKVRNSYSKSLFGINFRLKSYPENVNHLAKDFLEILKLENTERVIKASQISDLLRLLTSNWSQFTKITYYGYQGMKKTHENFSNKKTEEICRLISIIMVSLENDASESVIKSLEEKLEKALK